MRGVTVTLPTEAADKLMQLKLDCEGALDASRSANVRLQRADDRQMKDRLQSECDRHNKKQAALSTLLSHINQFLVELRPGVELELAPPVTIERKRGEDVLAALDRSRAEISALKQKINAVKRSPLPKEDQHAACVDYVSDLLRQSRPKAVTIVGDRLRVVWKDDIVASRTDALALAAFIDPGAVLRALEHELVQPINGNALSVEERKRQVAELEKTLDQYERCEETLIERAAQDGLDVPRRQDASPVAVLGVVVAKPFVADTAATAA